MISSPTTLTRSRSTDDHSAAKSEVDSPSHRADAKRRWNPSSVDLAPASESDIAMKTSPRDLPKVHAVIIHHRGLEMLGICLDTLLQSTGVDLTVVVVSNNCQESMPPIADLDPRVHVAETGRPIGFSEANNFGVQWAKRHLGRTDFYYFLNNDTESRVDTLSELVEAVHKHPKAAAAGPLTLIQAFPDHLNSLGINVTEDAWGWDEGIGQSLGEYGPLPGVRKVLTITGSAYLLDAGVYDEVGGWTEAYGWYFEDIDLGIKIWKRGYEVIHVPQSEILHRVSATMTVGAERKKYFFWRNRLMLATIHWPLSSLWSLAKRAIYWEILKVPRQHTRLQRKALLGFLPHLPKALWYRFKLRGDQDWVDFLRPVGSVPVIRLPTAETAKTPPDSGDVQPEDSAEPSPHPQKGPLIPVVRDSLARDASEPDPGHPWMTAKELRDDHEERLSKAPAPSGEREDPASAPCRRILVLGWGPLPFENQRMNYAPGVRSYHFAQALAAAGHAVCLAYARIPGAYFGSPPSLVTWREPGDHDFPIRVFQMETATFDHPGGLESLVELFDPHVLVGAAPIPSRRAARLAGHRPVWVDLFGDPMTEAQAKDRAQTNDENGDHLTAYWQLMRELLARGDAFSSVSERQKYSAIGQLGLSGRLNRATAGHDLVRVIPCAVAGDASSKATSPEQHAEQTELPEDLAKALAEVRDHHFTVLWSGGFNTWCDVHTLFDGLEAAMNRDPKVRFVATGGRIDNHDHGTYHDFQSRVEASPLRDRFILLGCLPKEQAEQVKQRAQLVVITERSLYERELGSSARLLECLAEGRPCLCTEQSELGAELGQRSLALSYATGDTKGLADQIVWAAGHRDDLQDMAQEARRFVTEQFSYCETAKPLVEWAAKAKRAADLDAPQRKSYHALADRLNRAYEAEETLYRIYSSKPYRLYKGLRGLLPF